MKLLDALEFSWPIFHLQQCLGKIQQKPKSIELKNNCISQSGLKTLHCFLGNLRANFVERQHVTTPSTFKETKIVLLRRTDRIISDFNSIADCPSW
jgi:hypothetical protein